MKLDHNSACQQQGSHYQENTIFTLRFSSQADCLGFDPKSRKVKDQLFVNLVLIIYQILEYTLSMQEARDYK